MKPDCLRRTLWLAMSLCLTILGGPQLLRSIGPALGTPNALTRGLAIAPRTPDRANDLGLSYSDARPVASVSVEAKEPLVALHEKAVAWFLERPGFGIARIASHDRSDVLATLRIKSPAGSPESPLPSIWSPLEAEQSADPDEAVAGLGMQLESFELVSLMVHDEPEVYLSDRPLPMDQLAAAPTRPLDDFEKLALPHLRQGEELFILRGEPNTRMLGAVRTHFGCTYCHGGKPGDLLGAFSYTLRAR